MDELKQNFPQGVEYRIVYDPTINVRDGIREVVITLFEAILLVVLVVVLFLQTWRASIIPLVAVPVSIVGTFAILLAFGFSINTLSLFGLVLAIGIVVDDAIVVVENVERNIEAGLSPRDAAHKAMDEVSRPIIAIGLVLCAVFVPVAFLSGLTGEFYRQFALTIAFSTVISAINSLTLSPALSAILLKPHGAPPDRLTRWLDRGLGWLFRPFNRVFARGSASVTARRCTGSSGRAARARGVRRSPRAHRGSASTKVPSGFVPTQDKQYLVAFAQLPDAATLDRTEKVIRQMADIGSQQPGVENAVQFPGLSINGFVNAPNAGIVFFTLKPFDERHGKDEYGLNIAGALNGKFSGIQDAFVAVFPPPAVNGLGTGGRIQAAAGGPRRPRRGRAQRRHPGTARPGVSDARAGGGLQRLSRQRAAARCRGGSGQGEAAKASSLTDLFQTMQAYLGSVYVNDFNKFGRTYQVKVQADAQFRATAENIAQLKVRNAQGAMVPLGSVVTGEGVARPRSGRPLQRVSRRPTSTAARPRASAPARRSKPSRASCARCCRTGSATSGPT